MESHLRPLSLGEILDRTAQLYRTNFLLLAGISAVYAGVLLLIGLAQVGAQAWLKAAGLSSQLVWVTVASIVVSVPVVMVAGGLAVAANNRAVAWLHLGEPATISGAYRSILPRLGRYLWLMIVVTFVVYLPLIVVYAAFVGFAFVYIKPLGLMNPGVAPSTPPDPQALVTMIGGLLVLGLLLLAALVYAVLMGLRYALAVPACVIEDIKARDAIRRSILLTKGARGRIFVLGLLVVAIQMGLGMVTQIFFVFAAVKHHGDLPALVRAAQQVVAFFTNSFIGPIYATGFTLFYYDQRVRKEGFDIEWMMQSAGLGAGAPASDVESAAVPETPHE